VSQWAAIIAGGSGTRFWPLSTPSHPKQFLPLAGPRPLLVEAVDRLTDVIAPERVLIVTGTAVADHTRRLLPALAAEQILAEPRAASTAPALTWATHVARTADPEAVVLSLHADWWVGDRAGFAKSAGRALDAALEHDALVTVGIVPARPEIGYGYIERGSPLGPDVWEVRRFTEKPDAKRAARLIADGALWNSGLFAWTADRFFAETAAHAPEVAPHVARLDEGDIVGFFQAVQSIAVDVSHFERSGRVVVLQASFPWDDVGTWTALERVRPTTEEGNVVVGDVVTNDTTGSVIWTDGDPVVVDGVAGLVVVRANGRILVTTRARAAGLKDLLQNLPPRIRDVP
jgi:mannose-1-phosphate guanylyltransferase